MARIRRNLSPVTSTDDLLTVAEVAAILRVHVDTVRRWIASGRLRAVHIGGTRRVPRSALAAEKCST